MTLARFPAGLSLVSVPLVPATPDPMQLGFQEGAWLRWNSQSRAYAGYKADPAHFTWFEPAQDTPGKAYWDRFASEASVTVPEEHGQVAGSGVPGC